jgi:hypothetical protein
MVQLITPSIRRLFKWRYEKTDFGNSQKIVLEVVEEVISV